MYTVTDVVDMGEAQNLILTEVKEAGVLDDWAEQTMEGLEYFDE